jgi:hypothetical protein
MNLSKIEQRYYLNEKPAKKHKKQIKNASEIQNLNGKNYCSQPTNSAQHPKTARGLLPAPAWAPGPTTAAWAGEAAQRHPPPGLNLAHAAALLLAVVDL